MSHLAVSATAHGVNYLPQYFADHLGLFADHGIEVTATARDPWTGVLDDLDSGAADVALGGLWVPAMYAGTPRELTVFAQVNHQFPKALVTRTPRPDFSWSELAGRTVLAPGIGGSAPYAITAGLMREAGVDPATVTFLRDLSTPMFVELFEAGLGDAIVLDHTSAEDLRHRGSGDIAVDYTATGGLGPNSVYYCRTDRFASLHERLVQFVAALEQSMGQLATVDAADLRPLLAAHWPDTPEPALHDAVGRMLGSQTWHTTRIDRSATRRWMRILLDEHMIRSVPEFDELVDSTVVDAVRPAPAPV